MNPEITLDDYKTIGMMETALSAHADEAFFELSTERQKIAEKIFKCLTETDRENREIRRAMTIKKLCAIAEADFPEVAAVIETFRQEGRTFLMPPPEVELDENTLIDISHESLIRKWGRLKNWVEEEWQSAKIYGRLAEDALSFEMKKKSFWSDPELSEAIKWRDTFHPNESWAEIYKEKGTKHYQSSFDKTIKFLNDSEANRKRRKQMALGTYFVLILAICAAFGATTFALTTREQAKLLAQRAQLLEQVNEKNRLLEANYVELGKQKQELEIKGDELNYSLAKQKEATSKLEVEKKRANEETEKAKISEAEKQRALEEQKRLKDEAETARNAAILKRTEAETAKNLAELRGQEVEAEKVKVNDALRAVFIENGRQELINNYPFRAAVYLNEAYQMSAENEESGKISNLLFLLGQSMKTVDSLNFSLTHQDSVKSAAFSPDGKKIVTASRGEKTKVWDVAIEMRTKEEIKKIVEEKIPLHLVNGVLVPR